MQKICDISVKVHPLKMYCSKLSYIIITFYLPICHVQAQKIDKQRTQFHTENGKVISSEYDSTAVELNREYQEWLKNEPLKIDVPEVNFHNYAIQRFVLSNPIEDNMPPPAFHFDAKTLKNELGIYHIAPNLNLSTGSSYNQVQGLSQNITTNFNLFYHKRNLTLSGGVMVGKYQNFIWNSNVAAFHASAEYQISNRIAIGMQGSFVPNVRNIGPTSIFTPTNSYGAYAKVRINSWLSLMPCINRYYDPIAHRWNTSFFIMPVFDFGRLFRLQPSKKIQQKERLRKALENY